jgi:hypothetical protein
METPNCNSSHAGRTSYGCPYAIHRDEVIAFNKAQSYPIGRTIDLQPVFMKTELAQELWATTHEDSAVCGIAHRPTSYDIVHLVFGWQRHLIP